MTERDSVYLKNLLDCISSIHNYTKGMSEEGFMDSPMVQDAVIRNFEIIGEASKMISQNLRTKYDDIPWKNMAGMRDVLIHNYMGVDLSIIWATIQDVLPKLEMTIKSIII